MNDSRAIISQWPLNKAFKNLQLQLNCEVEIRFILSRRTSFYDLIATVENFVEKREDENNRKPERIRVRKFRRSALSNFEFIVL